MAVTSHARPNGRLAMKLLCALVLLALAGCAASKRSDDVRDAAATDALFSDAGTGVPSCVPVNAPMGGFRQGEGYLETENPTCPPERPVCLLATATAGAPAPACERLGVRCFEPVELAMVSRCSCRCEAPAGVPTCACAAGETCEVTLESGGIDIIGSYCVSAAQRDALRR